MVRALVFQKVKFLCQHRQCVCAAFFIFQHRLQARGHRREREFPSLTLVSSMGNWLARKLVRSFRRCRAQAMCQPLFSCDSSGLLLLAEVGVKTDTARTPCLSVMSGVSSRAVVVDVFWRVSLRVSPVVVFGAIHLGHVINLFVASEAYDC